MGTVGEWIHLGAASEVASLMMAMISLVVVGVACSNRCRWEGVAEASVHFRHFHQVVWAGV